MWAPRRSCNRREAHGLFDTRLGVGKARLRVEAGPTLSKRAPCRRRQLLRGENDLADIPGQRIGNGKVIIAQAAGPDALKSDRRALLPGIYMKTISL